MVSSADPTGEMWLDEDAGPLVRPYAMTRGRTRPTVGDFDLISQVVAIRPLSAFDTGLGPEHAVITGLCRQALSVAEIAAHLDLPVGIVRVLLGDLLDKGLISVRAPQPPTQMPNEGLFEAVINGLRSL
jgi:hypothetical protein